MPREITEFPKWVDGVLCKDAEEEAALAVVDKKPKPKSKPKKAQTNGDSKDDS